MLSVMVLLAVIVRAEDKHDPDKNYYPFLSKAIKKNDISEAVAGLRDFAHFHHDWTTARMSSEPAKFVEFCEKYDERHVKWTVVVIAVKADKTLRQYRVSNLMWQEITLERQEDQKTTIYALFEKAGAGFDLSLKPDTQIIITGTLHIDSDGAVVHGAKLEKVLGHPGPHPKLEQFR